MKFLNYLFLFFCFLPTISVAQNVEPAPQIRYGVYLFNPLFSVRLSEDQIYVYDKYNFFGISLQLQRHEFSFEGYSYAYATGNSIVGVRQRGEKYLISHHYFFTDQFYAGSFIGGVQSTTQLISLGNEQVEVMPLEAILGALLGYGVSHSFYMSQREFQLRVFLEMRAVWQKTWNPNLTGEGLLKVGFYF